MARPGRLEAGEVAAGLDELTAWSGDTAAIGRTVTASSFASAIDLVTRVAAAAEELDHHPAIDIRWRTVRFALTTHDAGGVSSLDLALARRIDAIALDLHAG